MLKRLVLCLLLVASQTTFAISDIPNKCNVTDGVKNVCDSSVTDNNKVDNKTKDDDITDVEIGIMSFVFALFWVAGASLFFNISVGGKPRYRG